jgi:hypothetical protein
LAACKSATPYLTSPGLICLLVARIAPLLASKGTPRGLEVEGQVVILILALPRSITFVELLFGCSDKS